MLSIVVSLFFGWLLHFIGLDSFFHNLIGFNETGYYLIFFTLGFATALNNIFRRKDEQ
jgi:hypothetical protein